MSSTKFVFFGLIRKQKWPPWLIPQKGGTLYSGARYVALWASCYYNAFSIHVHDYMYAISSGLCLRLYKFCKRLPEINETLPFTRVIVSPLIITYLDFFMDRLYRKFLGLYTVISAGVHISPGTTLVIILQNKLCLSTLT